MNLRVNRNDPVCPVLAMLRNNLPHRGPRAEGYSGRLERAAIFISAYSPSTATADLFSNISDLSPRPGLGVVAVFFCAGGTLAQDAWRIASVTLHHVARNSLGGASGVHAQPVA